MKIIAFYLPQFHNIPENDKWWGDGFTEWTNVKAAYPIFEGHKQPKVPLNRNYYNLLDDDVKIWQAKIAKENGIYGFCYYHYWFNGKMLLEKPMEQMLANKAIDMPFCICWANEPWAKTWVGNEKKILIPQVYGTKKDWIAHFDYLSQFFYDERYIKENGKPVVVFYRPNIIPCLNEMTDCWRERALKKGLTGLSIQCIAENCNISEEVIMLMDKIIEWQPHSARKKKKQDRRIDELKKIRRNIIDKTSGLLGVNMYHFSLVANHKKKKYAIQDYDEVWNNIISMNPICLKSIPGAFVRWDNSPRYHERGTIIKGESPEKFEHYMKLQIEHAKDSYNSDTIYLYAWNEWAEGGYLEPDEEYGFEYLKALKNALASFESGDKDICF